MKKTKYLLTLLAAGTILTAGIGQAMAYFTTYAEAEGGFPISLGDETKITENFDKTNWKKILTIQNVEGQPVYVRAQAFKAPDELKLEYEGAKWDTEPDKEGYVYYHEVVNGKGAAEPLSITIKDIPGDVVEGDTFNVIVIYESVPVLYDTEGNPDWEASWDDPTLFVTGRTEFQPKSSSETEGGGNS